MRGCGTATPPRVEMLTRPGCCLCDTAREIIEAARAELAFTFVERDISRDPVLLVRYQTEIPVVLINGQKVFKYRVDPARLRRWLQHPPAPAEE